MTTFQAPPAPGSSGDKFDLSDHKGNLLLIDVTGVKEQVATAHGPADAIACNIAVLDGPDKGTEYADTLLFPKVIFNQLKTSVGTTILARLDQGAKQPGKNPPWILNAGSDADGETAAKYVAWKAKQAASTSDDF